MLKNIFAIFLAGTALNSFTVENGVSLPKQAPYANAMVKITENQQMGKDMCTGFFVNSTHILTASHCFIYDQTQGVKTPTLVYSQDDVLPTNLVSVEGSFNHKNYPISKIMISPTAQQAVVDGIGHIDLSKKKLLSDLAIITLKSPAKSITTIALNKSSLKVGQKVTLVGYGRPDQNSLANVTQINYGQSQITNLYPQDIINIAAGKKVSDEGDSGGPALIDDNGTYKAIGITYGGYNGQHFYTSLSNKTNADWIASQIRA